MCSECRLEPEVLWELHSLRGKSDFLATLERGENTPEIQNAFNSWRYHDDVLSIRDRCLLDVHRVVP